MLKMENLFTLLNQGTSLHLFYNLSNIPNVSLDFYELGDEN